MVLSAMVLVKQEGAAESQQKKKLERQKICAERRLTLNSGPKPNKHKRSNPSRVILRANLLS